MIHNYIVLNYTLKFSETNYLSLKLDLLGIHDDFIYFTNVILGKKIYDITDFKYVTFHVNIEKQPDIISRWLLGIQYFAIDTHILIVSWLLLWSIIYNITRTSKVALTLERYCCVQLSVINSINNNTTQEYKENEEKTRDGL